jgi:hypothetical protein
MMYPLLLIAPRSANALANSNPRSWSASSATTKAHKPTRSAPLPNHGTNCRAMTLILIRVNPNHCKFSDFHEHENSRRRLQSTSEWPNPTFANSNPVRSPGCGRSARRACARFQEQGSSLVIQALECFGNRDPGSRWRNRRLSPAHK